MKRLTKSVNNEVVVDNIKDAIERLALYENMVDKILAEQVEYDKQIAKLEDPTTGKVHWRKKELVGKKLVNKGLLLALKQHGIEVEENETE